MTSFIELAREVIGSIMSGLECEHHGEGGRAYEHTLCDYVDRKPACLPCQASRQLHEAETTLNKLENKE